MDWVDAKEKRPKNGSRVIILLANQNGVRWASIADYVASRETKACDYMDPDCPDFVDYDEDADMEWAPEGFYEACYFTEINYHIEKVTHWMPFEPFPEIDTGVPKTQELIVNKK